MKKQQAAKAIEDLRPNYCQLEVAPHQIETRKQVLETKSQSKKKIWITNIEARIRPNKQLTVLVVDDSESDRLFIVDALSQEFEQAVIDQACDGKDAFLQVEAGFVAGRRYDMVFMDMNMDNFDGRSGISMIRIFEKRYKITKQTPICAVSGDDFEEDPELAALGVVYRVKKPITLPVLRMILKKATK